MTLPIAIAPATIPPVHRRIGIIYCIDSMDIGGTELNAVRTAERLDRERFDLSVFAIQADGPLRERYERAGVRVYGFPSRPLYGIEGLLQGIRMAAMFRERNAEIVHCHDTYTSIYGAFWARVARVPIVIASRRTWKSPHLKRVLKLSRHAYRLADAVIANSPSVSRLLREENGVAESRLVVVPNFVDDTGFDPMPRAVRRQLMNELAIPPGALIIGIVARLSEVKDHATLLRATALLVSRLPELHLVIVGEGATRSSLDTLVTALGITAHVHFAGHRPAAPNLHALFDISVLCSTSEAFSNSLVEAMAAGRPIVATSVGGNGDAIQHGENGFLVPPSHPERLAGAIEQLARDPELRATMGGRGRQLAGDRYGADAVIAGVEGLYERLYARGKSHRAMGVWA